MLNVIAIDGPVGSGKSTVSRAVAGRLGLSHLDTGAMYRCVALAVLNRGLDPESTSADDLARVAVEAVIEVGERVCLDGDDVTDQLRSPEVGRAVSAVAACPAVRTELVRRQRDWAAERGGGVVEGRDIASVVFPDATLKVFLTASDQERARRRSSDEDAEALARRDQLDSTRTASPLAVADGAWVLDTTGRDIDDVVDDIVSRVTSLDQNRTPRPAPAPAPGSGERADPAVTGPPTGAPRALYGVVRAFVNLVCRTYWRATYDGLDNIPTTGAFVLAPVHRSFIDFGLVAAVSKRRVRYMGKDSLWKVKWFGSFISALGAFPVRRGAADREALRRCIDIIGSGEPIVLFPEGTRQSGPAVKELFEGAAYVAIRTGIPIVPVGIGGSERALKKGERLPRPVKVHVVIGPPLVPPPPKPSGHPSRSALKQLTADLHAELQRLFDQATAKAEATTG
ncbi:MAG: 1-acyl-sn-glycerol-3-phosphate acyltransferase [Acidimicrobiaceae bacterium]|jgi:1-acyl-sn-glycerol-3-phosphate acyltransferase